MGTGDLSPSVHTPQQANATELNIVDMPSVELEAAGCKWLCTGKSGCYWACGGGRRLNTPTDDVLEIVSNVADANATALYIGDMPSVELQRLMASNRTLMLA